MKNGLIPAKPNKNLRDGKPVPYADRKIMRNAVMDLELPKRKPVRLAGYDYSQNGAYFVTICTHNRAHLFGEIVGATLCGRPNNPDQLIEKWLLEIENKYKNAVIDQFVIMPDHIHFILLKSGDHTGSPLPEMVSWFKTMTTNEYIKGVKQGLYAPFEKHIWQPRFYDHIIRNEEDYLEIWQYIDENSLAWEKTK